MPPGAAAGDFLLFFLPRMCYLCFMIIPVKHGGFLLLALMLGAFAACAQCEHAVKAQGKYKLDTLRMMSDDNTAMFVYWSAMNDNVYLTLQCRSVPNLCVDTRDEQVVLTTESGETLAFPHFGGYNCESRATCRLRPRVVEFLAGEKIAAITLRGLREGASARLDLEPEAAAIIRDYFGCVLDRGLD